MIEQFNNRLDKMTQDIILLKENIEDYLLTNEERTLIDEAMKDKSEGTLVSDSELF